MADERLVNLSQGYIKSLIKFYEGMEKEIVKELQIAILRGNDLKLLKRMKANVDGMLKELKKQNEDWVQEAIPKIYKKGVDFADNEVIKLNEELAKQGATLSPSGEMLPLAMDDILLGFGNLHVQASNILAENCINSLNNITDFIGRRTDDIYRTMSLQAVRGSIAGYDTWAEVSDKLLKGLADNGITGFRDKAGKNWNMVTYADMVAQTTTMEAHLQATHNRLTEHGKDLVEITFHIGACPKCIPWQGKVLSLNGMTEGYKTLEYARSTGLFHPRCGHDYGLSLNVESELKAFYGWKNLSPDEQKQIQSNNKDHAEKLNTIQKLKADYADKLEAEQKAKQAKKELLAKQKADAKTKAEAEKKVKEAEKKALEAKKKLEATHGKLPDKLQVAPNGKLIISGDEFKKKVQEIGASNALAKYTTPEAVAKMKAEAEKDAKLLAKKFSPDGKEIVSKEEFEKIFNEKGAFQAFKEYTTQEALDNNDAKLSLGAMPIKPPAMPDPSPKDFKPYTPKDKEHIWSTKGWTYYNDQAGAHEWGEQYFGDWYKTLITDKEREAINVYTGHNYKYINKYWRRGDIEGGYWDEAQLTRTSTEISKGLIKKELQDDIIVHRGVSESALRGLDGKRLTDEELEGAILVDKGFMSTALNKNSSFSGNVRIQIKVPKGSKLGAYVAEISEFRHETEFLFDRESMIRIVKWEKDDYGNYKLFAEAIDPMIN